MSTLPYVQIEPLGRMSNDNNNVPDARLGDIIAYVWNGKDSNGDLLDTGLASLNKVDHLDVVVGHAANNNQYPLVSGWSEDAGRALQYNERGWTYSEKDHTSLQLERNPDGSYPNMYMFAYLIHIRSEDDLNLN